MEPSCTHYFRRDSEQGQPLRYGAWRSWFTRRRCINILLSCKRRKLPRPRADMCHDEFPGTMLNECYYTKWCLFHIAKRLPEHTVTRLTLRPCRLPRRNSSPKENETIMLGLTLWRRRQRDFPQSLHRFNPWPSSTGAQTLPLTPPPPCPHPSELIKILNFSADRWDRGSSHSFTGFIISPAHRLWCSADDLLPSTTRQCKEQTYLKGLHCSAGQI